MTSVLHRSGTDRAPAWSPMPGWSIVADLTPPELRTARTLRTLRRVIVAVLVLVIVLCIAGYRSSASSVDSAQSALDATNARNATVQTEISRHSSVTQVRSAVAAVRTQLTQLLGTDVDVPTLVHQLAASMPAGMALTSLSVDLSPTATADPSGASSTTGISTLTISGTSRNLSDLTRYVAALHEQSGLTNILPTANTRQDGSGTGTWSLTLELTASRYSGRYGKPATTTPTTIPAPTASVTDDGDN